MNVFIFRSVMEKSFLEYYDFYEGVCKERLHLQGQNMQVSIYFFLLDYFCLIRQCFQYKIILNVNNAISHDFVTALCEPGK